VVYSRGGEGSLAISGQSNGAEYGGWERTVNGIEAGKWYRFVAYYRPVGLDYRTLAGRCAPELEVCGRQGRRQT